MNKEKEYISDDEVIFIGGTDWKPKKSSSSRRWKVTSIALAVILSLTLLILAGKHIFHVKEFVQSRDCSEVIASLSHEMKGKAGIAASDECVMGVGLKIYRLSGLKAHFRDTVPDYTDSTVYLVTRSSDYKFAKGRKEIVGDFIIDGTTLAESNWRAGFMAIVDGNAQIGVDRCPQIFRHIKKHKGSMFRQLALVSAGTPCKKQFILKGKVTRCAYATDKKGDLYFVETVNPETLYGFADALTEYGFIDAIYITGGSQPDLFYRTEDGTAHGQYIDDKPHELIVWTR